MIFKNKENVEMHIEFSEKEIDILNKTKKLILVKENIKYFINDLAKVVFELQKELHKQDETLAVLQNNDIETEIKVKD